MELYTVELGKASPMLVNIPVLDASIRAKVPFFSPTWRMELDRQSGALDQPDYIQQFYALMEHSRAEHPGEWDELLNKPRLAIACTCREDTFCHRHLLINVIRRLKNDRGESTQYMGEL